MKTTSIYFTIMILLSTNIFAKNQLLIPPTLSGTDIELELQNGTHQFYDGEITKTMGVNGNILGPTLILKRGDLVNFKVINSLEETTTIHWHGMHVSPENDGGPHTVIDPTEVWNPSFKVLDKAATYWYHPHLHMYTNKHVSKGIAGLIIVQDEEEKTLDLPRIYGLDDFPLVLQTKDFDSKNQIVAPSNSDDVFMVNATIDAELSVPSQVVRFRILNGSSMRIFNLGLSDNSNFYQITSDGGLLKKSIPMSRLILAPGERAEILVNFNKVNLDEISLKSYASELPNGIYGASSPGMGNGMTLDGYSPNPLNGADFDVLKFNIKVQTAQPVTSIISDLVDVIRLSESEAKMTRNITMTPEAMGQNQLNSKFQLNSRSFNMDIIDETVILGNTEIWTIFNQSGIAHPFHIHDVQFNILDINGNGPPENLMGRKDVILVEPMQTIRFIAKFEDFSSKSVPYMYHCHMLVHEDAGMMGQFLVIDTLLEVKSDELADKIILFPNPATSTINFIKSDDIKITDVKIYDMTGALVEHKNDKSGVDGINLSLISSGAFIVEITSNQGVVKKKIQLQR